MRKYARYTCLFLLAATAAQAQPVYPTVVYRIQRVAQTVPWHLAMLINGIRLTRRAKKVWAREMNEAKKEWRWLQRHLLRALARRSVENRTRNAH